MGLYFTDIIFNISFRLNYIDSFSIYGKIYLFIRDKYVYVRVHTVYRILQCQFNAQQRSPQSMAGGVEELALATATTTATTSAEE